MGKLSRVVRRIANTGVKYPLQRPKGRLDVHPKDHTDVRPK